MDINNWLKEALDKVHSTDPQELITTLENYDLVDFDETSQEYGEKWLEFIEKMKKDEHKDDVVILDPQSKFPLLLGKLEDLEVRYINRLPRSYVTKGFYDYEIVVNEPWSQRPGEEVGKVSTNSRKKVVVSNSGFPYPVPQKSKKRK